jgi:hypothetical protein
VCTAVTKNKDKKNESKRKRVMCLYCEPVFRRDCVEGRVRAVAVQTDLAALSAAKQKNVFSISLTAVVTARVIHGVALDHRAKFKTW